MSFEVEPSLSQSTSRRTIVTTGAKLAYAAPLVAVSMSVHSAAANGVSGGCLADGVDCYAAGRTDDLCGSCCSGAATYRGYGVTTCGACLVAGVLCKPDEQACDSCCNGYNATTFICN